MRSPAPRANAGNRANWKLDSLVKLEPLLEQRTLMGRAHQQHDKEFEAEDHPYNDDEQAHTGHRLPRRILRIAFSTLRAIDRQRRNIILERPPHGRRIRWPRIRRRFPAREQSSGRNTVLKRAPTFSPEEVDRFRLIDAAKRFPRPASIKVLDVSQQIPRWKERRAPADGVTISCSWLMSASPSAPSNAASCSRAMVPRLSRAIGLPSAAGASPADANNGLRARRSGDWSATTTAFTPSRSQNLVEPVLAAARPKQNRNNISSI